MAKSLHPQHRKAISLGLIRYHAGRAKTRVVKALVPKPLRDVYAGTALFGRALAAKNPAVAKRMKHKALQWTIGNRKEPSATGNWNGNTRYRKPT